jgi:hypothetical protein
MPDKGYDTDLTIAQVRNAIITAYTHDNTMGPIDLVKKLMKDAVSTYANAKKRRESFHYRQDHIDK